MAIHYNANGEAIVGHGTTGAGTANKAPNSGLTILSHTSAEIIVLEPPIPGVRKTILFTNTTSTGLLPVVRGSTAHTVTFSGSTSMGADNTALPTMFKLAATRSTNMATCVELVGCTTGAWAICSVYPIMTTGNGGGSITLSTT
jgi:hypothetical protein